MQGDNVMRADMRAWVLLGVVAGALLGGVVLLVLGAFLGGNIAPEFELAGLRGYEATGIVGLLAGMVVGGALGGRLASKRER